MAARGIGAGFVRVLLFAALGTPACSSDSEAPTNSDAGPGTRSLCESNGNCPNRTPPAPDEISRCESAFADPKCGAAFRAYFDCSLRQEKCTTTGVTDDAATRAAILQNCADLAAAYGSCSGSSSGTQCGLTGLACCTDGSPPCAKTACCDPATNKCRGMGEACSAADSVCWSEQCGHCGAPGEGCCPIQGMTQPRPCPSGGCCNYSNGPAGTCIAEGGQCDAPGPNSVETVCHSGSCTTCGSELGTCCAGNKCNVPGNTCSGTTCMP